MPSFGVSICLLTLAQALVVALPRPLELPALARLRSGWWALVPVASIVAFVFGVRALSGAADGLAYLALIAVPPLAALALAKAMRGARAALALAVVPLFALAWADRAGLAGEAAAVALDALSCVTLAVLLAAVTPRALLKLGIVVTAAVDAWLVVSDLLAAPNGVLNAVAPAAHLPQLQRVAFGSAVMGYEDLFVAGLLGALLAARPRTALRATAIAAAIGLAFNLLFLAVDELPTTVPIALALLVVEVDERRRARRSRVSAHRDRCKEDEMAYLKPPVFARKVFNPLAMRFGIGGSATLSVPRRRSGTTQEVPVIPVDHDGARYVVSTRGESEWVRNARRAGFVELRERGTAARFAAVEVPVAERGPILDAYRVKAGRTVDSYWKRLPEAADHPTFRLEEPAAG